MNPRHTLALSAVLAVTVLTGGAAVLGIVSTPAHSTAAAAPALAQVVSPVPTTGEEAD